MIHCDSFEKFGLYKSYFGESTRHDGLVVRAEEDQNTPLGHPGSNLVEIKFMNLYDENDGNSVATYRNSKEP